jgi:predicted ester cyclase
MSGADNKALVLGFLAALDANTDADWSVIDEFVAPGFVSHAPLLPGLTGDRDGLKRAAEIFRIATPGTHEILLQVAEDDLVVTLAVGRGVHSGELMGIRASNRPVEATGIAIHRIRDGSIVEHWGVTDVARILQQIGALPGPGEGG